MKGNRLLHNQEAAGNVLPLVVIDRKGCWLWTRGTNRGGYGVFMRHGKNVMAHREFYEVFNGPIAAGLQTDHLCRTPVCVNPAHIEAVTQQENIRRSLGVAAINTAKSTCPLGHPLTVKMRPSGTRRECDICTRARKRIANHKRWQSSTFREHRKFYLREWRKRRKEADRADREA